MLRIAKFLARAGTIAVLLGVLTGGVGVAQNTVVNHASANGAFATGFAYGSDGTDVGFAVFRLVCSASTSFCAGGTGTGQESTYFDYSIFPPGGGEIFGEGFIPNGDLVGDTGLNANRHLTLKVDTSALPGFLNESCPDFSGLNCTSVSGGPITIDWQANNGNTFTKTGTFTSSNVNSTIKTTGNSESSDASVQGTLMGIPFQDPAAGSISVNHGMFITITSP
jgi:hypothetical protein